MKAMKLTKQTQEVLSCIYKMYKKSIASGESIDEAMDFDYDFANDNKHLQKMNPDDIDHALRELGDVGAIKRYTDGSFLLMDLAVEYMENKTQNKVKELIDNVSKLKP